MKKVFIVFVLIFNSFFSFSQTFTQEVRASGGGYYVQINGSLQFTIGEPLIETYSNTSAKLYQGFEQGSYALVSVTELPILTDLKVNLFPNPSFGIFNLAIESRVISIFSVDVIDFQGKIIFHKEISANNSEQINLNDFSSSIYYVIISNAEISYLKTFKIEKL